LDDEEEDLLDLLDGEEISGEDVTINLLSTGVRVCGGDILVSLDDQSGASSLSSSMLLLLLLQSFSFLGQERAARTLARFTARDDFDAQNAANFSTSDISISNCAETTDRISS